MISTENGSSQMVAMIKKQTQKEYKKLCDENNRSLRAAKKELEKILRGK